VGKKKKGGEQKRMGVQRTDSQSLECVKKRAERREAKDKEEGSVK